MKTLKINIAAGLILAMMMVASSLQAENESFFEKVRGNAEDAVYTIFVDPAGFEIGDEVAVFDGSKLVGATTIVSENAFENFIPVFATLSQGEGYRAGNPISFKVYQVATRAVSDIGLEFKAISAEAHLDLIFPISDAAYSMASLKHSKLGTAQANVNLYPNPVDNFVIVQADAAMSKVEIFNSTGLLVKAEEISGTKTEINTRGLSAGVYTVRVTIDDQLISNRLVVK
jgi:hypothetical protein